MVLATGIGKVFEDGLIQIILQREFAPLSHARAWLKGAGREDRGERREALASNPDSGLLTPGRWLSSFAPRATADRLDSGG